MSDSGPLSRLRETLRSAFDADVLARALAIDGVDPMRRARQEVEHTFSEVSLKLTVIEATEAVVAFARSAAAVPFTTVVKVCYGISLAALPQGRTILGNAPLRTRLLDTVESLLPQPKRFRRCYQALLDAYFRFSSGSMDPNERRSLWEPIREFLSRHLKNIRASLRPGGVPRPWVLAIDEHKNLLTNAPGARYVAALERDELGPLREALGNLGVSRESWIWEETLLAYVRHVTEYADQGFKSRLDQTLTTACGQGEFQPGPMVKRQAVALLVKRYFGCNEKPEHATLRDAAVKFIGHPRLKSEAWDAFVGDDGARQMIKGWLNRRLMTNFFELLAHEGSTSRRRLDYWLNYEPYIDDMWFCLGSDARSNNSQNFVELRERMREESRILDDTNPANNAFVMKVGSHLLVEFGVTGNALYIYPLATSPINLTKRRLSTVADLKRRDAAGANWLSHQSNWEHQFDAEMRRILSGARTTRAQPPPPRQATAFVPPSTSVHNTAPSRVEEIDLILSQCRAAGRRIEDRRGVGGALWIRADAKDLLISLRTRLKDAGFRFTEGKGFWIND